MTFTAHRSVAEAVADALADGWTVDKQDAEGIATVATELSALSDSSLCRLLAVLTSRKCYFNARSVSTSR